MRNAMLLFLSMVRHKNGQLERALYHTKDLGLISAVQTNEAAVKYMMESLKRRGEKLDKVFLFATKEVQEKIDVTLSYPDGEKISGVSSLELFQQDMIREYPELKGCFENITLPGVEHQEDIMQHVLKMAVSIEDYADSQKDQLTLHTDLTGGLRHITVLMNSILHMLKYRGVKIGEVIYANYNKANGRIENVSEIHRMVELISGTDTFMAYGNVREINEYYSGRKKIIQSEEHKNLLASLRDFSDAVCICNTGKFTDIVRNLAVNINKFKMLANKTPQEELFAQLLTAIESDYKGILSDEVSQIDIIKWCLRKGYLQQSMTLFNEWMPEIIVKKHIYYPNEKYIDYITYRCLEENMGYKNNYDVFVHSFAIRDYSDSKSEKAPESKSVKKQKSFKPFENLKKYLEGGAHGKVPVEYEAEKVNQIVTAINCADSLKRKLLQGRKQWPSVEESHPKLVYVLECMKKGAQKEYMSTKDYFLTNKITSDDIFKMVSKFKPCYLYTLLETNEAELFIRKSARMNQDDKEQLLQKDTDKKTWEKREKAISILFENGIVKTDIEYELMLQILQDLVWVREQRNTINHAGTQVGIKALSNQKLIKKISEMVERIDNVGIKEM